MMKHFTLTALAALATLTAQAQVTPTSQMEKLDRGLIAVKSGSGVFCSWRLLGTDDESTTFDLLRDGKTVAGATNLSKTNYQVSGATVANSFQVVTKVDGIPVDTCEAVTPWASQYLHLKLDKPAAATNPSGRYQYTPNDCSVGDVDGDGQYEIILKWDPDNSKDNSQGGYTGNVFIDCYKLDGTKMWRVNLGPNIRAGAHYTQFMVYDFDGDGKAEMMCKTGPGSKDGLGNYVNQAATDDAIKKADNSKDWRNSNGRVNGGQEYLTVFDGMTGKAIHTIAYKPNRNAEPTLSEAEGTFNWGSGDTGSYGNRGERYLAAVAYLDGADKNPSGIFSRGYYTYAHIWAVDFDGQQLHDKWLSSSTSASVYTLRTYDADGNVTSETITPNRPTSGSGSRTMYGNGNHNLSIGDVDGDGKDEIIWGSAALDDNGKVLYGTGFGHGDAIHLSVMNPDRGGMQVFQIHEEKGTYSWDLHDAATGQILFKGGNSGVDNGRGMAAQLSAKERGFWFSSADDRSQRSALTGEVSSSANGSTNFRVYWDGTLQDALLDGNKIDKYNDTSNGFGRLMTFYNIGPGSTCNGTKNTPNLSADILGDWREEVILWDSSDSAHLAIYTTVTPTNYRVQTLMHDHTYRMGIAWQNTAYNQPPHLGYYLPDAMLPSLVNQEKELTARVGEEVTYYSKYRNATTCLLMRSIDPEGKVTYANVPAGFERTINTTTKSVTITGAPTMVGDYKFIFQLNGGGGERVSDTIIVHATEATGIEMASSNRAWMKADIDEDIRLTFHTAEPAKADIQLSDLSGRTLFAARQAVSDGTSLVIPATNRKGVLVLKVKAGEKTYIRKFVK